jgi:hypothetical protein
VKDRFVEYHGLDAVRYSGFPRVATFTRIDLDAAVWPVASGGRPGRRRGTIEHLENPWAFVRQLAALAAPGGWLVVTTPIS